MILPAKPNRPHGSLDGVVVDLDPASSPKVCEETQRLAEVAVAAAPNGHKITRVEPGRAGAAQVKAWQKRQGASRKPAEPSRL